MRKQYAIVRSVDFEKAGTSSCFFAADKREKKNTWFRLFSEGSSERHAERNVEHKIDVKMYTRPTASGGRSLQVTGHDSRAPGAPPGPRAPLPQAGRSAAGPQQRSNA